MEILITGGSVVPIPLHPPGNQGLERLGTQTLEPLFFWLKLGIWPWKHWPGLKSPALYAPLLLAEVGLRGVSLLTPFAPHCSKVDDNPEFDNLDIVTQDAEERYFDEEEPGEVLSTEPDED